MWFSKPKPEPEPSLFIWSDEEHSVGVSIFDQEHERLIALMGQIHLALQHKQDRHRAESLLETLIHETQAHFDHEESVMRNIDFAEREAHTAEHAALIQQANALLLKVRNGSISALAIPNFLKTWLMTHMRSMDRKYASCMRRNGLH
ncbi:hypothetical protein GETHLI_32140 [Geothrix limicola]|uniref:Hemerythrin-like domain-containing protein n=1 Tax=Geothrix limicola TaxID=2927978 RepID=A0ABQ5QJ55_9BACT|nr:hypothetical protein GETHLI_32140 [Geothrix limicola]